MQAFYQFWNHVEMLEVLAKWTTILTHSPEISNNNRTTFDLTLYFLTGFFFGFEFPKPSRDARKVAARLHVSCRCQWVFRWMCKLLHASGPGGRCPNTRHTSQFLRYTRGSWHACLDGSQWKPIWWWGQPLCMRSQLYCSWSPSFCMVLFVCVKRVRPVDFQATGLTPTTFCWFVTVTPQYLFVCLCTIIFLFGSCTPYKLVYQTDIFASIPAVYSVVSCVYLRTYTHFGVHAYVHIFSTHIHTYTVYIYTAAM